eukprot:767422-Hanusia_phi.AAC.2
MTANHSSNSCGMDPFESKTERSKNFYIHLLDDISLALLLPARHESPVQKMSTSRSTKDTIIRSHLQLHTRRLGMQPGLPERLEHEALISEDYPNTSRKGCPLLKFILNLNVLDIVI